jgi:hydrogenase maturation protease
VHLVRDALPDSGHRAALRVIGVGNAFRTDDGVGLAVARALVGTLPDGVEVLALEGEPTSLIDAWAGAADVWLVDAVSSGAQPGAVSRIDAATSGVPAAFARSSTHHFGLPEAIELARAVGRLPQRLIVYGIEGAGFGTGQTLSPEVEAAVEPVAAAIRAEVLASIAAREFPPS